MWVNIMKEQKPPSESPVEGREHRCKGMAPSGEMEITGFTTGNWSLEEIWTGDGGVGETHEVFDIHYCPFCGVKLEE